MTTPSTSAVEKLKRMGYRVSKIQPKDLPLSRQNCGDDFYKISINGDVVQNQRDTLGYYTASEVEWFAAKLPTVKQANFLTLVK